MKNLILFIAICASCLSASAQQNAINENKVSYKWADEYNYNGSSSCNYLNRSFGSAIPYIWWFHRWHENSIGGQDNVAFKTDCSLLDLGNGDLTLKATQGPYNETWTTYANGNTLNPPHYRTRQYGGNWITTFPGFEDLMDMDYGIYEVRFKLPPATVIDANGNLVHRNEGMSFAAGLYGVSNTVCHAEIDFFEMSGHNNQFTHNFLWGGNQPGDCVTFPDGGTLPTHEGLNKIGLYDINKTIGSTPERYAGFYKQGHFWYSDDAEGYTTMTIEVTPQKITWYMNGRTLQSTTGDAYHTEACNKLPTMEFGFAVSVGDHHDPNFNNVKITWPDANSIFPFEVDIDYFRFQKFKCNAGTSMDESTGNRFPNTQMADFVYQNISIADDGVGGARITNGENVSLRAVEYIELLPGFEVELGGELYADVHECDN